jgi:hypothetical protein
MALCQVYSQNYDLIVKSNGDSIACRIDSITDSNIYFEMINRKHWIHTNMNRNEVIEYKHNAIDMKSFVFKPGSSTIQSPKKEPAASMRDVQKNSVYVGILTIYYSRMIPGDRVGFTVSGGLSFVALGFSDEIGLMAETTLLLGGTKHFFEPGIMLYYDFELFGPTIRTGYRYQGPDGFLFRAGLLFHYLDDFGVLPVISVGYSF